MRTSAQKRQYSYRCLAILVASVATLVVSCGKQSRRTDNNANSAAGFRPLFNASGKSAEEARGHWHCRGYGYRVTIRERGVEMYCQTESFLYRMPQEAGAFLTEALFKTGATPDILCVTDHPNSVARVLVRDVSPVDARELNSGWSPQERFLVFVETMREHFAFFELWGVDWEQRFADQQGKISAATTDAELFDVCAAMLKGIDDAHFGFSAIVDGEPRSLEVGKGPTKRGIKAMFEQQREFDDLNKYFNSWYQAYLRGVEEQLLGERAEIGAGNRLRWGWLNGKIGYLHLIGLGGYGAHSVKDDLQILEDALDRALQRLDGADAIILDLTYNQGGEDVFGQALAQRFANERSLAFTRLPLNENDQERLSFVEPSVRVRYEGPLYVVTSDITMSAAETLVLYLRVLPQVTVVGQPTRGAFSDVLEKPLPHGAQLMLSSEVYQAADGECYERRGIPPDVVIPVFDAKDPWSGHIEAIRKVQDLASEKLMVGWVEQFQQMRTSAVEKQLGILRRSVVDRPRTSTTLPAPAGDSTNEILVWRIGPPFPN